VPDGSDVALLARLQHLNPDGGLKAGHVVPLNALPESFQSFGRQVATNLNDLALRTILTLRWRQDIPGPHSPVSVVDTDWSRDGRHWHPMPATYAAYVEMLRYYRVRDETTDEVVNLVSTGVSEPLAHQLWREAWSERGRNSRSAVVLGVAAAEVGFKACAGDLVPRARWLVEAVPAPPLVKMLREYLPQLPARASCADTPLTIPATLLKTLERGIAVRNRIAHVGQAQIRRESVEDILLCVKDVLWILDFYAGFAWALEHVRTETRSAMGL
jgi:hypothetical protein